MTAPDRSVRSLRLRAGSEEEIGRVLPRLEDALRCASLPDTGARVLLVRKLALGRIAGDASSQTLSRLIELRMTEAEAQWVPGGTSEAGSAGFVSFASGLEARTQLALRLVRGEPYAEWYWPLAVPELRSATSPAMLLRSIAEAIARLPEGRVALPVWIEAVVTAGGSARLLAAIDVSAGQALLQQAGIPLRSQGAEPRTLDPSGPERLAARGPSHADTDLPAGPGDRVLPRWLQTLLIAAGGGDAHARPGAHVHQRDIDVRHPEPFAMPMETAPAPSRRPEPSNASGPDAPVSTTVVSPAPGVPRNLEADLIGASASPVHTRVLNADIAGPRRSDPLPGARAVPPARSPPYLESTACAGLLFLLPVLARLGIEAWSTQAEARGDHFAHRVLMAALRRLRVPADDPVWAIVPSELQDGDAIRIPAPARWDDPLLAPPRARLSRGGVVRALAAAPSVDTQATLWLTAARRWLRRGGGIGLASLALRSGSASLTPTHVDIHFRVNDSDMRVRRLALDIDPGWLPWFGQVVSFHYEERLP
jgi:hypothetical protein